MNTMSIGHSEVLLIHNCMASSYHSLDELAFNKLGSVSKYTLLSVLQNSDANAWATDAALCKLLKEFTDRVVANRVAFELGAHLNVNP